MNKKAMSLAAGILLGTSLVVSGCGGGSTASNGAAQGSTEATYSFKLTHVTQPSHIWHRTAEKFNEELQQRSNGRMKVDLFPASQLGTEKDMVQQIQSGSIEFGIITNAYMSTREDAFNGWHLPFVYSDLEQAAKAKDTDAAKEILKTLDQQGMIGLDFILAGNRHILMKDGAVQSPEELNGKKLRVIGSPAIQDFWTTIGASPTPMPLSEVYTSLQTGVIDGIDIDLDALVTQKYYEIAKDLTVTNHMTFPGVVVMSKAAAEKWSPEDRKIVEDAMKAAVEWGTQEAIKGETANLEQLKANGVNVVELQDAEKFRAVKDQIIDTYTSKNPIIKAFYEASSQ